ncbi:extracellular solute-binding protein, partial [Paenibacillus sp. LMG 31461]|nr:extracellular solute-binding protein [Paenibacillus plantarum]
MILKETQNRRSEKKEDIMLKQKKKIASVIALSLIVSLALAGCGTDTNQGKQTDVSPSQTAQVKGQQNEQPVELTFYIANSPVKDMDRIMGVANKIIKEKINATLKLVVTDWSAYPQKVNLMISSGEPFDLAFTGSFGELNYFQIASKGAFKDITSLLDKYAPTTKSRVPENIWQGVKVNG